MWWLYDVIVEVCGSDFRNNDTTLLTIVFTLQKVLSHCTQTRLKSFCSDLTLTGRVTWLHRPVSAMNQQMSSSTSMEDFIATMEHCWPLYFHCEPKSNLIYNVCAYVLRWLQYSALLLNSKQVKSCCMDLVNAGRVTWLQQPVVMMSRRCHHQSLWIKFSMQWHWTVCQKCIQMFPRVFNKVNFLSALKAVWKAVAETSLLQGRSLEPFNQSSWWLYYVSVEVRW